MALKTTAQKNYSPSASPLLTEKGFEEWAMRLSE
jgi:hypothetical protein